MHLPTFILTTPLETASWISASDEPDPPWKTKNLKQLSRISHVITGPRAREQTLFLFHVSLVPQLSDSQGLLVSVGQLLSSVLLVLSENLGSELDVTGLVDTVNVSESGGDGEVGGDLGKRLVDVENVLRLGVQAGVVDVRVVDTVLLSSGDTDLHLEPLVHLGHPLEVLDTGLNVLLLGLLGQVQHVRGEEGDTVLLEVGLVGVQHSVEPGQELLGAVVRVHDDGDSVSGSDGSDESGGGDGTGDRGLLLVSVVLDSLSGPEGGTSLGDLEDDGRVDISGGLQGGVGGGGRSDVLGWINRAFSTGQSQLFG
jgi:hypothetical protein